MRSLNTVYLIGRLGKDAESKTTPSGVSVAGFQVATERNWKDQTSGEWKKETDWHRVVLWRNEKIYEFLTKGTPVHITGRLQTRSFDKDGTKHYVTEVVAENVILLGGSGDGGQRRDNEPGQSTGAKPYIPGDDDVPF